jgi:cobalt-zinc-cadmium efflux system outer membrane protein
MKHIRQLLPGLLLLVYIPALPQASLDSLMIRVLQYNRSLSMAGQYFESVQTGAKRNLYLDNPEVGFGYLWGTPSTLGDRTDLEILQSFSFPTVYSSRMKLGKAEIEKAFHILANAKLEKLLEAKKLWIEKVYLNRAQHMLSGRMAQLDQVSTHYQLQYENGEISKISLNKALLLRATLVAELYGLRAESLVNQSKIRLITGDHPVEINDSMYYLIHINPQDTVIMESMQDPLYQAYLSEIDRLNMQKRLTRATGMPEITTGYYSENTQDLSLRGVRLGVTIPLWGNAHKVKHASAEIMTAELEADQFRQAAISGIDQLYARYRISLKKVDDLSEVLDQADDPGLLSLAVKTGEISMIEYFYEAEMYYRTWHDLLQAEKQLYLLEAELNKYGLYGHLAVHHGG